MIVVPFEGDEYVDMK